MRASLVYVLRSVGGAGLEADGSLVAKKRLVIDSCSNRFCQAAAVRARRAEEQGVTREKLETEVMRGAIKKKKK